jgi:DNA-binding XRE family transcriptional regulator
MKRSTKRAREEARAAIRPRLCDRFEARLLEVIAETKREHPEPPLHQASRRVRAALPSGPAQATAARMAGVYTDYACRAVELLVEAPELYDPVLGREDLVSAWGLAFHGPDMPADLVPLAAALGHFETLCGRDARVWPSNVSLDDVSTAIRRTKDPGAEELITRWLPRSMLAQGMPAASGDPLDSEESGATVRWPIMLCAHIVSVAKRVDQDRRILATAIDAGRPHSHVLGAMRDLPKDWVRHTGKILPGQPPEEIDGIPRLVLASVYRKQKAQGHLAVLAPGLAMQLTFPFDVGPYEAMTATLARWRGPLQDWKGPVGLRHWAAVQRLFSIEGAREGKVKWTMERHLDAMGAPQKSRDDAQFRRDVGNIVELLTKIELAVYANDGKLRLRAQILSANNKIDRKHGNAWALEGVELAIHPLLYSGVRKPDGQLGSNWYPQTAEIAKLDHVRHPHALVYGLVLPIRWRWAWGDGLDHFAVSGANLLKLGGIENVRLGEAWKKAQRALDKLQEIDALRRVEWDGEPWTLNAICRLYSPEWAHERIALELPPVEPVLPPVMRNVPTTGAELRAWRQAQGLTQAQAAERLGVSLRTIKGAEAKETEALGWACAKAFARLGR